MSAGAPGRRGLLDDYEDYGEQGGVDHIARSFGGLESLDSLREVSETLQAQDLVFTQAAKSLKRGTWWRRLLPVLACVLLLLLVAAAAVWWALTR
jgi:hypothetical protein